MPLEKNNTILDWLQHSFIILNYLLPINMFYGLNSLGFSQRTKEYHFTIMSQGTISLYVTYHYDVYVYIIAKSASSQLATDLHSRTPWLKMGTSPMA